ncbi:MAG: pyruvate kinase [Candidatus Magasanikbacteria bacterium]
MKHNKRTKIVCTLGPASETKEIITGMVKAGMNVARLNFSHGTHANHKKLISTVRAVEKETGEPIAILQDLQGPKIRIGIIPKEGIELKEESVAMFDTALEGYTDGVIPIHYDLHKFVKKGERLLINDGRSEVVVLGVSGTTIRTEVVVGGIITSNKGINIPDTELVVSALTEKDKKDARFGVEHGVDMMALSFVMNAKDILDLRFVIKEYEKELGIRGKEPIRIIAKIERNEAVNNIVEILGVVDGIMVARGDLGIEVPVADVPLIQKKLIDLSLEAAKPVIVATQMLDSMQNNPRPTRAEVSDVSGAVVDHTDAVMLSNESATGKYPVKTVKTMANIISETEKSSYDDLAFREPKKNKDGVDDVISGLSRYIGEKVGAKLILAASISGETGRLISRYRPELPVIVVTNTPRVQHQLNLSWGIHPLIIKPCRTIEELIERSVTELKKRNMVKSGESIIVVAGEPVGQAGHVNLLEVKDVE